MKKKPYTPLSFLEITAVSSENVNTPTGYQQPSTQ